MVYRLFMVLRFVAWQPLRLLLAIVGTKTMQGSKAKLCQFMFLFFTLARFLENNVAIELKNKCLKNPLMAGFILSIVHYVGVKEHVKGVQFFIFASTVLNSMYIGVK